MGQFRNVVSGANPLGGVPPQVLQQGAQLAQAMNSRGFPAGGNMPGYNTGQYPTTGSMGPITSMPTRPGLPAPQMAAPNVLPGGAAIPPVQSNVAANFPGDALGRPVAGSLPMAGPVAAALQQQQAAPTLNRMFNRGPGIAQ